MEYVDAHIVTALGSLRNKLESKWQAEVAAEKGNRQEIIRKFREITDKRDLLKSREEEIKVIKSEESILLGTKAIEEDYTFSDFMRMKYYRKPYEYSFTGSHTIHEVRKTAGRGCKWHSEQQQGANWKGTLKANGLTSLVGSVTFYTTGALKYQDKLIYLEKECARLEAQLEILNHGVRPEEVNMEENKAIAELEKCLKECTELKDDVDKQTFAMSLYPSLKHIYLLDRKPSRNDIFLFIQVYNRDLADMHWREQSS
jgi:hypothetical protein